MDRDITGVESWRRTRLGNEPIYCAAPPPSDPDDIICLGSDEELDDAEKIAKRLRYEAQALRYLQGKPVRIMSASLHGPFDEASGWKNPWLPKQPAVKKSVVKSKYTANSTPSFKDRLLKSSQRFEQKYNTTSGTDSSMRCHLPSPESNRELQFSGHSLETEKQSRIQAWTKEVSRNTILERDEFWAPNQVVCDDNGEPRKKRPIGQEWLRKTSKRKKLSSSQNTNTKFTPTPLLSTQAPIRSTSVPLSIHCPETTGFSKLKANHSFELATPSSTISRKCPELKRGREIEVTTQGETTPLGGNFSSGAQLSAKDIIVQPTGTKIAFTTHDCSLMKAKECGSISDPERTTRSNESPVNLSKQDTSIREGAEEDSTFESYVDQSFHYRARPPKESTPIAGPVSVASIHSKLTQTGTTETPKDEDVAAVTIPRNLSPLPQATVSYHCVSMGPIAIAQASVHLLESMYSREEDDDDIQKYQCQIASSALKDEILRDQTINGDVEEPHKCNETIGYVVSTEPGLYDDPKMVDENLRLLRTSATGMSILAETANALHPENTATEYNVPDVVIHTSHVSHIVFDAERKRSVDSLESPAVFKTHPTDFALLIDEGSTLTNDPINFNRATPIETTDLLTLNHVSNNADARAEAHDPTGNLVGITRRTESDSESDPVTVPLPQLEWSIGDDKPNIPIANVEEALEKDTPAETAMLDRPSSVDLTVKHIKLEPVESGPSYRHHPYQTVLPGSQTKDHEVSWANPLQQNPWAKEILDPAKPDRRDLYSRMVGENIPTNILQQTVTSAECQNHWPTTDIDMMTPSERPPASPTPPSFDNNPLFPHPQPRMLAQEPDNRLSEHRVNTPTTPPRGTLPHVRTPDLESSIKPFSLFNTPSPKRRRKNSTHPSTGRTVGILSNAAYSNPRDISRGQRRVSFAPLPNEDNMDTSPVFSTTRAASPPPRILVNAGDEDVDNQFQGHFDAMKLRASSRNVRLRLQPRLLPSPSQQKPASPHIGAMAEAFRGADAYAACGREGLVETQDKDGEDIVEDVADIKQSPWRKESQGIDHVADVMENLDDFLNAWDVNVELQKARQESGSRDSFDGDALW
ncbi:uncharacterized protein F4812DRAFT_416199 [Daldinia caldariorum]|uniref:uncharacterized protein n=1 Tax=Daldinia caldariorum TaxID=326644 RepID=UPI00200810C9|nr:uncharacterized protein F4812DRAFT_416199 [Daldinia caldariorum]KAI1471963.1 hypothetical protein F4812DRAFT_416199 [Daldinia caldariorum]